MPSDDEDEKAMEARFERETATAEEWAAVEDDDAVTTAAGAAVVVGSP